MTHPFDEWLANVELIKYEVPATARHRQLPLTPAGSPLPSPPPATIRAWSPPSWPFTDVDDEYTLAPYLPPSEWCEEQIVLLRSICRPSASEIDESLSEYSRDVEGDEGDVLDEIDKDEAEAAIRAWSMSDDDVMKGCESVIAPRETLFSFYLGTDGTCLSWQHGWEIRAITSGLALVTISPDVAHVPDWMPAAVAGIVDRSDPFRSLALLFSRVEAYPDDASGKLQDGEDDWWTDVSRTGIPPEEIYRALLAAEGIGLPAILTATVNEIKTFKKPGVRTFADFLELTQ